VVHSTALNSSDNLPGSYPPDNRQKTNAERSDCEIPR